MVSEMHLREALRNIFIMFYPVFEQSFAVVSIILKDGPDTHSIRHDLTAGGIREMYLESPLRALL
jgi:hypothetical protein